MTDIEFIFHFIKRCTEKRMESLSEFEANFAYIPDLFIMNKTKNGFDGVTEYGHDESVLAHVALTMYEFNQLINDHGIIGCHDFGKYFLMVLFHDIGKTDEYYFENKTTNYKGHTLAGERLVDGISIRYKFDSFTSNELKFWARNHSKIHGVFNHPETLQFFVEVCERLNLDLHVLLLMAKADLLGHINRPKTLHRRYDNDNLKNIVQKAYNFLV